MVWCICMVMVWSHLFQPMQLPETGKAEEKTTCAPDSITNHAKALKSLLIALGLHIAAPSPPMWNSNYRQQSKAGKFPGDVLNLDPRRIGLGHPCTVQSVKGDHKHAKHTVLVSSLVCPSPLLVCKYVQIEGLLLTASQMNVQSQFKIMISRQNQPVNLNI